MKTHQQVIAAALDEAWQHGTTGADAQDIITALQDAGYTIISTDTLRTALNFGYGKEPTPAGAIARANLREQLT